MTIQPYLFFEGRCDEALAYYQKALGAKLEALMRYKENPSPEHNPPGAAEKVMHCNFRVGDAQSLPVDADSVDIVASALALNFVPDRAKALAEMQRVARPGATIAFYVWDYPGGGIEFMRAFWTAATRLDASASSLTEDRRFPFCTPDGLRDIARDAGLSSIEVTAVERPSIFKDFDDYWHPFTLGAGPAPGYCKSLPADARERLRASLSATLPRQPDGSIHLMTRAWALRAMSR